MFALANGLMSEGMLSAADASWLRRSNELANAAYADPTTVAPDCYDAATNPGAASWFKASATELLELAHSYLDLLNRHQVRWVELRTSAPGHIVYEDHVQVVAVPFSYPGDWPFPS